MYIMYVRMYFHLKSLSFEYLVCPRFFYYRYWKITLKTVESLQKRK